MVNTSTTLPDPSHQCNSPQKLPAEQRVPIDETDISSTPTEEVDVAETAENAIDMDVDVEKEQEEEEELDEETKRLKEKQNWIKRMRMKFCVQEEFEITKTMVKEDGMLNQDYFRPPKSREAPVRARKWTDRERDSLIQGIEKHGIGHFREISEEFLPEWSGNDLRVKCMRLIGRQNLQLYKNWKGDAEAIQRELERNKEIGLKYDTWKNGTLVCDDEGLVLKAIEASEEKAEIGPQSASKRKRGLASHAEDVSIE